MVEETNPDALFEATLDKRYKLEVLRNTQGGGTVSLYDTKNENELVFQKDVDLLYGAVFGADIADIDYWKDLAVNFVDRNKEC